MSAMLELDDPGSTVGVVTDRITSLDDTGDVLATFTQNGLNTITADNSAIFLGIDSDSSPIDP
jgi:hypothetical protein